MKTFLEPLTPDEEKIYIEKMRLGDKKAKDILIERNLRLVAHVAIEVDADSTPFDNVDEEADFPDMDEPKFKKIVVRTS